MFLAPRQRKTTVCTRFWASASKNHGIYSVVWPGPSKNTGIYAVSSMLSEAFFRCQRHKNIVNYIIFTRGQYQKNMKNWAQQGPPKRIFEFYPLFSHPEPRKTWKPQHPEGFSKRSAAPARPRVAKAMRLATQNGEASPEWANDLVPPTPLWKRGMDCAGSEHETTRASTTQHIGISRNSLIYTDPSRYRRKTSCLFSQELLLRFIEDHQILCWVWTLATRSWSCNSFATLGKGGKLQRHISSLVEKFKNPLVRKSLQTNPI